PPFQIDGAEKVGIREQHLRLAKKQKSGVVQGEVKTGEDARLRFGVEIHQHVAADEQVNTGDGRVLNQIVAAKDDGAAQILAKGVAAVVVIKIFFQQGRRNVGDIPPRIAGLPRLVERVIV